MGGSIAVHFFVNLYEIFKNFSYYISKVNDLPSGRKEKNRCWADRFLMSKRSFRRRFWLFKAAAFISIGGTLGECRHAVAIQKPDWYLSVKKSLTPATAHSTHTCENRHFLTAHNVITCTRMASRCPGAFLCPGQRHRPCCRSPPLSFRPRQNLNERKMQDGNYHQEA